MSLSSWIDRGLVKTDLTDELVAGKYDPVEDVVHLNPELMSIATVAEEFYHRRQDKLLEAKGITTEERDGKLYLAALEIGIIPQIRDIAKAKGNSEADYEFFRYVIYARKFADEYLQSSDETRAKFTNAVGKEKLFDGISWVLKIIHSDDYKVDIWSEMAMKDSKGEAYWSIINDSRKEWVTL